MKLIKLAITGYCIWKRPVCVLYVGENLVYRSLQRVSSSNRNAHTLIRI